MMVMLCRRKGVLPGIITGIYSVIYRLPLIGRRFFIEITEEL